MEKMQQIQYMKNEAGLYICPHCDDYTTPNQSTMHYHMKKHDGALPHACKHCDSRFLQKKLLELHVRSRHKETTEEKEKFKCPCNDCNYEDIRKGNRLIHFVRMHLKDVVTKLQIKSEDAGFVASCSCCQKNFKSMTLFYYHAAGCVNPSENHPFHDMWVQLKND